MAEGRTNDVDRGSCFTINMSRKQHPFKNEVHTRNIFLQAQPELIAQIN